MIGAIALCVYSLTLEKDPTVDYLIVVLRAAGMVFIFVGGCGS